MKNFNIYLIDDDGIWFKYSMKNIKEIMIAEVIEKTKSHEKEKIIKKIKISEL